MDRLVAERGARWAIAGLLPPLLLLSNLYILISPAFLDFQYALELPPAERFTAEERVYWAKATLEYLRSPADSSYLETMADEQGPLYNQRELAHMADVKILVDRTLRGQVIILALVLLATAYLLTRPRGIFSFVRAIFRGSTLTIIIFGLLGLFIALAFSVFFTTFHRLFFVGDTWLFQTTDTLIQLFPPTFWYNAVLIWAALTLGEAGVLGVLAYIWSKRAASRNLS